MIDKEREKNMSVIIGAVKYSVKPGLRDEVMKLAKVAAEYSRKEKGSIAYAHYPSMENDQDMFVFETWESMDDVEAHLHAPHYLEFSEKRKPMLVEGSYELKMYEADLKREIKTAAPK
jgi:quinol monooxygenase YgiN